MLILEIDGFDVIYGSSDIERNWRIGDEGVYIGRPDLFIGGVIKDPNCLSLIDPKKSTRVIQQQLEVDKGGSGSVQSIKIALVDQGGKVTEAMSPGYKVDDVLGQEATVYLAFEGGAHPEDSFRMFQGVIDSVIPNAGFVTVSVSHPSKLEDKELFTPATTDTTAAILAADNMIPVVDNSEFFNSVTFENTQLEQYIKIGDEIIKVGYMFNDGSTFEFRGCTRGMFGTIAKDYSDVEEVNSYYKLKGDATDLALALLLSDGEQSFFADDIAVTSIVNVSSFEKVHNAVFFQGIDVKEKYGLVVGDWIEVNGVINPLNEFYEPMPARQITGFGENSLGTWLVVDGVALQEEISPAIKCRLKSRYNVLPDGCGLNPRMVDIDQFIEVKGLLGAALAYYDDFKIDDEINAKDFINEQIFLPSGLYQVPRKGKISVDSTLPSIAGRESKVLNEYNILNADKLAVKRSINENFYNAVIYKYDFDELETDKPRRSERIIDLDSKNRIGTVKRLTIEAMGLGKTQEAISLIQRQNKLYLDRYKFAAESIVVETNLKTGFNIDISDTVILAAKNLKLSDTRKGSREFSSRVMQVINKSFSFSGKVELTLLDTSFSNEARYGTIAPSSIVMGGTTTEILLKSPYRGLDSTDSEKNKWQNYIGERVVVRSDDWTQIAETKILSFDDSNTRCAKIEPLPFTPTDGMWLDVPNYDESDTREMETYKTLHPFLTPQIAVASATDEKTITVETGKGSEFFVDSIVNVHNADYSQDAESTVLSVLGDVITLKKNLGFTPDNTHVIDLIGFNDGGLPYRIL